MLPRRLLAEWRFGVVSLSTDKPSLEVPKRVVVVGPTASGKTALAMRLAEESEAEVLCVDAMTVYRGMDIGTAKVLPAEQKGIVHHGIDLVEPSDDYSVAQFQRYANDVIADANQRNVPLVMVGGTGLYMDAVINDFTMPGQYVDVRAALQIDLEANGVEKLYARLVELDPVAAAKMQPNNDRRILRALEVCLGSGRPFSSFGPGLQESRADREKTILVAIAWPREELRSRIETRFAKQLVDGFVAEAVGLLEQFGESLSRTARQALGYRELWSHLAGECSLDEAVTLAITRTRQFAVRQERWFKRDPRLVWLTPDEASECSLP
jgi:tRNA dimethylallyltransferase